MYSWYIYIYTHTPAIPLPATPREQLRWSKCIHSGQESEGKGKPKHKTHVNPLHSEARSRWDFTLCVSRFCKIARVLTKCWVLKSCQRSLRRWLGNYVNAWGAEVPNTFLVWHQLFLSPLLVLILTMTPSFWRMGSKNLKNYSLLPILLISQVLQQPRSTADVSDTEDIAGPVKCAV